MRATYGHTVEIELDLPSSDIPDSYTILVIQMKQEI